MRLALAAVAAFLLAGYFAGLAAVEAARTMVEGFPL